MPETKKEKSPKAKSPEAEASDGSATSRSLSARAERSLKDVDRLLQKRADTPPQQKAMAQLEQAKVSALLDLAEAIRENREG